MAIALRGTPQTGINTSGNSQSVNVPAGVVNGSDYLFGLISGYSTSSGGTPSTPLTPSGWTAIGTDATTGSTGNSAIGVYYRLANSEPASYTFSNTGGQAYVDAGIIAYSGVDTSSPFNLASASAHANANTLNIADLGSTTRDGCWVLVFAVCFDNITSSTGLTADVGWDGVPASNAIYHKVISPAGATSGLSLGSNGTDGLVTWAVAIQPPSTAVAYSQTPSIFYIPKSPGYLGKFIPNALTSDAPRTAYADISSRIRISGVNENITPSPFYPPQSPSFLARFTPDPRGFSPSFVAYTDIRTRLIVNNPTTAVPESPFYPPRSPSFLSRFPARRAVTSQTLAYADVSSRFLVAGQPEGLVQSPFYPPQSPSLLARFVSTPYPFGITPIASAVVDVSTRFLIQPLANVVGILPNLFAPGNSPSSFGRFQQNPRAASTPSPQVTSYADVKTRLTVISQSFADAKTRFSVAGVNEGQQSALFLPPYSPSYFSRFSQSPRSADPPDTAYADISTRLVISATSYADIKSRFIVQVPQEGLTEQVFSFRSPSFLGRFFQSPRSNVSSRTAYSDVATRLTILATATNEGFMQAPLFAGSRARLGKFLQDSRSSITSIAGYSDAKTRFVVNPPAGANPYLFTADLGRAEALLGQFQLGIDRTYYVGALLTTSSSINTGSSILTSNPNVLELQGRQYNFTLQSRSYVIALQVQS